MTTGCNDQFFFRELVQWPFLLKRIGTQFHFYPKELDDVNPGAYQPGGEWGVTPPSFQKFNMKCPACF
jgi:hypothetical protein